MSPSVPATVLPVDDEADVGPSFARASTTRATVSSQAEHPAAAPRVLGQEKTVHLAIEQVELTREHRRLLELVTSRPEPAKALEGARRRPGAPPTQR